VPPPSASAPLPSVAVCAPAPSVLAPLRGVSAPPPSNTVLPAWMIAWRTGCTPNETLAMTAMAARPAVSQSDPMRHPPGVPSSGSLSPLLPGLSAGVPLRWRARRVRPGSCARASGSPGQVQCPRQVQNRARSTTPDSTASSQGRGGCPAMRVRMLSSPSVPGSTPSTASDRARRSASSMPSSGEDGFSPTCPPGHGVSCSRIDLRAAIARAV
jgi:hypothetical protein